MGFQQWWVRTSQKFYRVIEKGLYIFSGVAVFLFSLITLLLLNCSHRLVTGQQEELTLNSTAACLTGEGFPFLFFLFSVLMGFLTIGLIILLRSFEDRQQYQ